MHFLVIFIFCDYEWPYIDKYKKIVGVGHCICEIGPTFCKLIEAKPLPATQRVREADIVTKIVVFCKRVLGSWK
jgi:hypothetical protein